MPVIFHSKFLGNCNLFMEKSLFLATNKKINHFLMIVISRGSVDSWKFFFLSLFNTYVFLKCIVYPPFVTMTTQMEVYSCKQMPIDKFIEFHEILPSETCLFLEKFPSGKENIHFSEKWKEMKNYSTILVRNRIQMMKVNSLFSSFVH